MVKKNIPALSFHHQQIQKQHLCSCIFQEKNWHFCTHPCTIPFGATHSGTPYQYKNGPKARTPKKVRNTTSVQIDLKINSDNAKSSYNNKFWKNEPKAAAYLGYSDVREFRKFRFSWLVLEWYILYMELKTDLGCSRTHVPSMEWNYEK